MATSTARQIFDLMSNGERSGWMDIAVLEGTRAANFEFGFHELPKKTRIELADLIEEWERTS